MVACIVQGLQDTREVKVIHNDIKPLNILIDEKGYLKICDYGLSQVTKNDKSTYWVDGTYNYTAPEVVQRKFKYGY